MFNKNHTFLTLFASNAGHNTDLQYSWRTKFIGTRRHTSHTHPTSWLASKTRHLQEKSFTHNIIKASRVTSWLYVFAWVNGIATWTPIYIYIYTRGMSTSHCTLDGADGPPRLSIKLLQWQPHYLYTLSSTRHTERSKAGIPRDHFPRNILARMSAASRSCMSGPRNFESDTTRGQTGSTTCTAGRPIS